MAPVQVDSIPLSWQSILLSDALKRELIENTLNTSIKFLNELLPCERLPFPVDTNLLRKLLAPVGTKTAIWNFARNCFHQLPTDFGEDSVCNWLNDVGAAMGRIYGRQCRRLWWSGNCGIVTGSPVIALCNQCICSLVLCSVQRELIFVLLSWLIHLVILSAYEQARVRSKNLTFFWVSRL